MFGIEFGELISFLRQIGFAIAGASSLWGIVFYVRARRRRGKAKAANAEIALRLLVPFLAGTCVAVVASIIKMCTTPWPASAHEGLSFPPTLEEAANAMALSFPFFLFFVFFTLIALYCYVRRRELFLRHLGLFYFVEFSVVLVLISLYGWKSGFDADQLFYIGHTAHSIFTFGTVLALDYLFFVSKYSALIRKDIYEVFPAISKVIWVGLGIDFLSVALVFDKVFVLSDKFFFMQTVVAVLIVNGAYLSGPVTKKFLSGKPLSEHFMRIVGVSGSLSIASWTTLYFTDFFYGLTLSYISLMAFYIIFFTAVYSGFLYLEQHGKELSKHLAVR